MNCMHSYHSSSFPFPLRNTFATNPGSCFSSRVRVPRGSDLRSSPYRQAVSSVKHTPRAPIQGAPSPCRQYRRTTSGAAGIPRKAYIEFLTRPRRDSAWTRLYCSWVRPGGTSRESGDMTDSHDDSAHPGCVRRNGELSLATRCDMSRRWGVHPAEGGGGATSILVRGINRCPVSLMREKSPPVGSAPRVINSSKTLGLAQTSVV